MGAGGLVGFGEVGKGTVPLAFGAPRSWGRSHSSLCSGIDVGGIGEGEERLPKCGEVEISAEHD